MELTDKIHVVDDFYRDPLRVRELALSLEYENETTPNYPGFQSRVPCLSAAVISKFEGLVAEAIDLEASRKQMGFFRYIPETGTSRLHVHTDLVDWTAVVYLNPTPDPASGTCFYRHQRTGLIGPPDRAQMQKLGFRSFSHYEAEVIERDTLSAAAWEKTFEVENRFNRCVIFRSSRLFHSHHRSFGTGLSNARLTQNFFFNAARNRAIA